jgi:hypothetical protein
MKKIIFFVVLLFAASVWTSCRKDKWVDPRDSFVATYGVTETWIEKSKPMSKPAFSMSVEKSSQYINMILMNNFGNYGAGVTVEALVNGTELTISQQTLPNLKAISGSGILTDTTLSFTYKETYNNISFDITTVAKKK